MTAASLIVGFSILILFFLPAALAYQRHHVNFVPILLVNLIFGASVIGWFVALIWALSANVKEIVKRELQPDSEQSAGSGSRWVNDARAEAEQFVEEIRAAKTLQLEMTQGEDGVLLHTPNRAPSSAQNLSRLYVYKIDAYRKAVAMARSGGFETLLLFVDGGYRPRGDVDLGALTVEVCDTSSPSGRIIKRLLWPRPAGISVIGASHSATTSGAV
jgi:hypothetical protein